MKEFIRKWSNWWVLNPKRKQLDDAFEKELNELIEREVSLRTHDVVGQKEKLETRYGYFVHWHHDLYGGLTYNGVFDSEEKAKEYADNQEGYDEIYVLFLPYVEFNGKIFALWEGSAC